MPACKSLVSALVVLYISLHVDTLLHCTRQSYLADVGRAKARAAAAELPVYEERIRKKNGTTKIWRRGPRTLAWSKEVS
jgi:hypothetical protein